MTGTIGLIVVLIVVGLALLLMEILTPTFGVLAALAVTAFGTAVWFAYALSGPFAIVLLLALIVLVPVYLTFLVRWLPRTPLGRRLFLRKAPKADGAGAPEAAANAALVGKTGRTETMLRPSGAIRIEGRRVIALSESGIIGRGQPIKVIQAGANNVIVRRLKSSEEG